MRSRLTPMRRRRTPDADAQPRAATRAAQPPSAAAGPVGRGPRFVDEDTPLGIEIGLGVDPGAALARNGRAVLLARPCPRTDGGSMPRR
ncbi:MAG: hypothetical protein AAGA32_21405, partial [Pseudomonadota bacterium]